MITHHDLFEGNLGKLKNIGGSRYCATPNTAIISPQYSINVSYNIQGDLIGHSLDGRLWLYRRSKRLGIIALKWNSKEAKLKYAAAQNISNNDDVVLACGIDWVLTNKNIFMVSDEEPYILSSNLFDADIPDIFSYSERFLIDPFTYRRWGENGSFSKDTHLLYPEGSHSFEQCYSLLPPVGDRLIFENFLIQKPDASNIESYNYMHSLRPLIPLEFAYSVPTNKTQHPAQYITTDAAYSNGFKKNIFTAYGTGYNLEHRGIQLLHDNGQIWARGLYNIGKVSLLPAIFDEEGKALEYYLYISPEFPCSPFLKYDLNQNDDWLNTSIFIDNEHSVYGFLSKLKNTLDGVSCFHAREAKLFLPQSNEWADYSDNNGQLFLDVLNSAGLVLNNKGASFILNNPTELACTTISQWFAPAGILEAIDDKYIAASTEDAIIATSCVTEFNRFLFSPYALTLSAKTYKDNDNINYRLTISERTNDSNRKVFDVNSIVSSEIAIQPIAWEDIYKKPVEISIINSFAHEYLDYVGFGYYNDGQFRYINPKNDRTQYYIYKGEEPCYYYDYKLYSKYPLFITEQNITVAEAFQKDDHSFYHDDKKGWQADVFYWDVVSDNTYSVDDASNINDAFTIDYQGIIHGVMPIKAQASIFYINPEFGLTSSLNINITCEHKFKTTTRTTIIPIWVESVQWPCTEYITTTSISYMEVPICVVVCENKIGWVMKAIDYSEDTKQKRYFFKPVTDVPSNIVHWGNDFDLKANLEFYSEQNSIYEAVAPQIRCSDIVNSLYPYMFFYETITSTGFSLRLSSEKHLQLLQDFTLLVKGFDYPYELSTITAHNGSSYADKNLHVVIFTNGEKGKAAFFVFRSQVFNDTFDFNAEFERSKPS